MKTKTIYRVFDWDIDGKEDILDSLTEAIKLFDKQVKENPEGSWRLYKDTEKPYGSGNFTEDCLMAHNQ